LTNEEIIISPGLDGGGGAGLFGAAITLI